MANCNINNIVVFLIKTQNTFSELNHLRTSHRSYTATMWLDPANRLRSTSARTRRFVGARTPTDQRGSQSADRRNHSPQ